MPALNFMARFAGPVERREKRHSIRANAGRFAVGWPIQLYTGMRTKACRKLVAEDPRCTALQRIVITPDAVIIDEWLVYDEALLTLARNDGFDSVEAFRAFFLKNGATRFDGTLIKWDWTS